MLWHLRVKKIHRRNQVNQNGYCFKQTVHLNQPFPALPPIPGSHARLFNSTLPLPIPLQNTPPRHRLRAGRLAPPYILKKVKHFKAEVLTIT